MQVVLLPGDRKAMIAEYPDPVPGPGEVLIALRAAGICGSDLHLYRACVKSAPRFSISYRATNPPGSL